MSDDRGPSWAPQYRDVGVLLVIGGFLVATVVVGTAADRMRAPSPDTDEPPATAFQESESTESPNRDQTAACDSRDAGDERANATRIATDTEVQGALPPGDEADWYAVNVTAGEGIIPTLTLLDDIDGQSVSVHLYNGQGDRVTEMQWDGLPGALYIAGHGPKEIQDDTAEAPDVAVTTGTYYVRVTRTQYATGQTDCSYAYSLTVDSRTLDPFEPNENGSMASPLALGETAAAVGAPYDHDVYVVNLTEGTEYSVQYAGPGQDDESVFMKQLLYGTNASNASFDTKDTLEVLSSTFGRERTVTFTAQESGPHYILLAQSNANAQLIEHDGYHLTIRQTNAPSGETSTADSDQENGTAEAGDDCGCES